MPNEATSSLPAGKLFIGGVWIDARSGRTFETINPATNQALCRVAEADETDVDAAVQAARKAFEQGPWPKMSAADRSRVLWRIADLLMQRADEVARLETLDNGKPIFESRQVDIPLVAEIFQYYAGWATKITGETIPARPGAFTYTLREPLGVVAAIVPWNFPLLLASWKIAPALAAGNTVIVKPSSNTPLSALKFAEIVKDAGLPDGVLNVVTGKGSVAGMALVRHPGVDKIAFTGDTRTGVEIMKSGSDTLKRITLELGGKSPNIVFADADLEAAVRGATVGIFYGKGEVCAAGSRLFVEKRIHEEFLDKLAGRAKKTVPGDPLDPKTRFGALVSQAQMEKVLRYIASGKEEGARLVAGGERTEVAGLNGNFVLPTIFDQVKPEMRIAREEIFGPVLSTLEFSDPEEAVAQANASPYGLAAGIWTRDVAKAHRVARALKAGTVWINTYNRYDPALPFGGYKRSGYGRELGSAALEAYTQIKSVWVDVE
ncbi:MAG TPA: betaine-aldehyde dehydrogenase [Candidatus Polarisedimenticolia bacterium]|jgi:acyl-CoA reductase-like NAD-dependent aldehyde dehydrogenase|nr:betaine-aldehyde dehydrogenase [Candidatus Polarisedimenticolia bacterium]